MRVTALLRAYQNQWMLKLLTLASTAFIIYMPYDITLCPGKNCPIRQNCYRFTDKIPGRKNFFASVPYQVTTNSCDYFISNRPDDNKIRLKADQIWQQMGCPNHKSVEYWLQAEKELM